MSKPTARPPRATGALVPKSLGYERGGMTAAQLRGDDTALQAAYAEGRKDEREHFLAMLKVIGFELRAGPTGHEFLLNVQEEA